MPKNRYKTTNWKQYNKTAQRAVGVGVLGGVISATVLGCLFVPLFFVVVTRLMGKRPNLIPLLI